MQLFQLYFQRNLKHTVCATCAQRQRNLKRFKEKTLRARSLMMDLLKKQELDLTHIRGHPGEDLQMKLEETVVIKKEKCNSTLVDEDMNILDGDVNQANVKDEIVSSHENYVSNTQYQLKCETVTLGCTFCSEEFTKEHEYYEHMSKHLQPGNGEGDTSVVCEDPTAARSGCDSSTHKLAVPKLEDESHPSTDLAHVSALHARFAMFRNNETLMTPNEEMDTIKKIGPGYEINDGGLDDKSSDGNFEVKVNINTSTDCGVYEVFDGFKDSPKSVSSCGSLKIDEASYDSVCETANEELLATEDTSSPKSLQIVTEASIDESKGVNDSPSHGSPPAAGARFTCDVCHKWFKQKHSLRKHINNHSKVKRFTCTFCPYKSKFQNHISTHVRTHTGEKPYTCKFCDFACAQNYTLARHMSIHKGEKPFACHLCEFSSRQNFGLVRHMRTHTGEKPYSCTMCTFKFAQHYGLVTHMRTHTGERPYACSLCEYSSTRSSALLRHMRTHTGEKPFSCNLCQHRSARRCDLMKHMRSQHNGKTVKKCPRK